MTFRALPIGVSLAMAAAALVAPAAALAGDAGSTRDFVLDFERSGVLKDLLAKTLGVARNFLFLATFIAYFLEAFGKSPLAERDYAAVTWRVLVVLILMWNYQAVFGGVIGVLDGLESQVAPPSTWKAFVKQSNDMRKALDEVASGGEKPSGTDGSPGSFASQPSGITAWAYDALIACIQLLAEAAVFLVNWLSRILTATLFVLGPLALVAGIPRVSSTGSRWFLRFVTIASWPVFSGVLLSVLVTLGAQGAVRRTYLECLVAALVMLLTALATPIIASHVIGGALDNAAGRGWASAKAVHRDGISPAFRFGKGLAGRVVAAGAYAAHVVTGGSSEPSGGGAGGGGGSGSGGGGSGSRGRSGGGGGGAVANAPGGGGSGRSAGGARGGARAAGAPGAAPANAPAQGGPVANAPGTTAPPNPKPIPPGGGPGPVGGPPRPSGGSGA
jgi:hypothetical protein